jgi:hypothetical protein
LEENQSAINGVVSPVLASRSGTYNRSDYNENFELFLVNPSNWRENRRVYWSRKCDSFVVLIWLGPNRPGGFL